jgi:PAS domain S-box-containing protein
VDLDGGEQLLSPGNADSRVRPIALWDNRLSWGTALVFVAAYAALLFAGYGLQINPSSPASFWPSGGLLFAALLLMRQRDWAWIMLLAIPADVAVNWLAPGPFIGIRSSVLYALTNTLDGVIGAVLARRWIGALSSPRQAAALYLAGAAGCMFSTTISAVVFLSRHPEVNPIVAWLRWWAGNVLGIVTIAPIAFTWVAHWREPEGSRAMPPRLQLAAANALLVVVTATIFGAVPAHSTFDLGLQFAVLPILILIALQCPSRWTMVSASLMSVLAVALTNRGLGPFSSTAQLFSGVFSLQIFLTLTVATTYILSVAADENRGLVVALTFSRGRYRREANLLRNEIERSHVIEQQRADALRRNAQLAALVRHSQEFIGIATLDGRCDYINEVGRKLIGMGPNDGVEGMSIADYVHPKEHQRLALEVLPGVIASGRWSGEMDFRRLSGDSAIPMLVEAFRISDADGRPQWIAAVCLDITEQKATTARLRASEAHLRTIIDTEPDCVKLISKDCILLDINSAGLAILEADSVNQARAHGVMNFICPEHHASFTDLHRRIIRGERGELEFEVVGLRGTRRWLHISAAPMWDESRAEPVLLGITSDITEHKRREQLRADAERENRQLAALVRHSKEFIGIASLDGRAQYINDYGRRMIGVRADENLDGRTIKELAHPRHRDRVSSEVMPVLRATGIWSGELDLLRVTDGEAISTLTEVFRIDDAGGAPLCLAAVSRDITELKQAAAERRELEQAYLVETDRQQSRLGREIHDGLGQELTGLSLLVSAVAAQGRRGKMASADELADIIAVARKSIATARGIARGLSPLTEHEGELIKSLRQLVETAAATSFIPVQFHERGEEPANLTQETRNHLYRIVQEALSNALRHSRATRIDVYFEIAEEIIRVRVADNGDGIADGPSDGLGLRTMRYRAMDIGGTFSVRREATGGTVIQCELPRVAGERPDGEGATAAARRQYY